MYADIEYKVVLYPIGFFVPQNCFPFQMVMLFSINILGHKQNNDFQNHGDVSPIYFRFKCCFYTKLRYEIGLQLNQILNYINVISNETLTNHWVISINSYETFQMYFIVIDFNLKKHGFLENF